MELNTKEALAFAGCSKNTFLKQKIPFILRGKAKFYLINHIEEAFTDKQIPRVLPDKPSKSVQVEISDTLAIELNIAEHQTAFTNILNKTKEVQGDNFQFEIASTLTESMIKASILEGYYFEQLQIIPESRDLFQSWKQSIDLKMNLAKRMGL